MSFLQNISYELRKHSTLTILIAINLFVFLILNISKHIIGIDLYPYLAMPLNLSQFGLKFWTLFTYMFSHQDLGHVFYNMLLLYISAQRFTILLNEKKMLFVYIMSGLSGAVILLILSALFPSVFAASSLFGASAAVIGVVVSLVLYIPNMPVSLFGVFEMKYKYFALLIFVLFTIVDFTINTGGKISHFGGAFFGLFFGYMLKNGKDISEFPSFKRKKSTPLKIVHSNSNVNFTQPTADKQQIIDSLLDKISKNGYESLSKNEKELLFKLSQKK